MFGVWVWTDFFILAPKKQATGNSVGAIMAKPWAPFSANLWVHIYMSDFTL